MTRIILVRHGLSKANEEKVFAGIYNTPLSETGHKQAGAVADYLKANEKVDKVFSSDLDRVCDTVKPTADAFSLEVIRDKGLREINGGYWECLPFDDLATHFKDDFYTWIHDTKNARPTGGESVREVYDRIVAHVLKLAEENDGKTIVLGTHWTPIRALLAFVLTGSADGFGTAEPVVASAVPDGAEEKAFLNPEVKNASIHVLAYENGKLTPVQLSIDAHLDALS